MFSAIACSGGASVSRSGRPAAAETEPRADTNAGSASAPEVFKLSSAPIAASASLAASKGLNAAMTFSNDIFAPRVVEVDLAVRCRRAHPWNHRS